MDQKDVEISFLVILNFEQLRRLRGSSREDFMDQAEEFHPGQVDKSSQFPFKIAI